jgi:tellurite resistance protein TehA-like permease
VERLVEGLTPGYFALVMASGIISLGLDLVGLHSLSWALFAVGAAGFVVLLVMNIWRLVGFRAAMAADFHEPRRAFGFFTFVAGTNVLGVRADAAGWTSLTAALLAVSGVVWLLLGYVVPWSAVLGREERPVVAAANGTWFIWVVASQSVAVAAAGLEPTAGDTTRQGLAVLAVLSWSVGIFLYAASAVFVSFRLMLYPLSPEDLDPPYWVSMGAVAITVVAGARIVGMDSAPMVNATRGLVAGLCVVFWCFATWLIPVLVAAGWWRHVRRGVPLRYEPTLWSIIFPLGMYSVAGITLGRADHLPLVESIGATWLWVAVVTWAIVLLAMLHDLWRAASGRGAATGPMTA